MSKIIQVFFYITILGSTSCSGKQSIQFEDISFDAGVADVAVNSSGPSFIDYDNDGDIDIYVNTEYHGENQGNRLFENDGSGYFIDVAVERGVDNKYALGRGASWGDYDNDGDMDLIVSNLPSSGGTKIPPTTLFKNLLIETGSANFRNATIESNLFRANVKEDREIGGIGNTGAGVAWAGLDAGSHGGLFSRLGRNGGLVHGHVFIFNACVFPAECAARFFARLGATEPPGHSY